MGVENFSGVPVGDENLLNLLGGLGLAFSEKDEDAGTCATEAATEEAGRLEIENRIEAGNEFGAVRLMNAVFESGGEGVRSTGGEGGNQQGGALDIENSVGARVSGGEGGAGLFGGEEVIGNDDSDIEGGRHL